MKSCQIKVAENQRGPEALLVKDDLSVHSDTSIGSNCGKTTKNTRCPRYEAHSVTKKYTHIQVLVI